ncbi:hypothetical protein FRC14_001277 [Serendipita sp. 396]|nr:hypothetical protein FRC14_001277 [Serendipita sp. 396]
MDKSSHLNKTRSSDVLFMTFSKVKLWRKRFACGPSEDLGYNAPLSHQQAENCHPIASVLFQDCPSSNFDMDPTSQS